LYNVKTFLRLNQIIMDNLEKTPHETFKVKGNWDEQSKRLKSKFSQLTDADLKFDSGKEDEMLKRVQSRLNKNREEVITLIQNNQSSNV
jgi:uncharacterized protein YjbJ (UPF0337 family)